MSVAHDRWPGRPVSQDVGRVVETVHVMGTVVTLDLRGVTRGEDLAEAVDAAADRLTHVDETFSTWQADSWVSRLLRREVALDDCPPDVRRVVGLAESMEELTRGFFSSRWHAPSGGPDPTGLVKGWAAQQASDVLREHGFADHVVNAAGDLVTSGWSVPGQPHPWRVGIEDPRVAQTLAGHVELPSGTGRWAVATSGTARQGLHVADPHDGSRPASVASATTVVAVGLQHTEAGAVADATATALVAAGTRADLLLTDLRAADVLGLVVRDDGELLDPDGLLALLS